MISVQAPGKLFIAGEYAVVEPGHPSIIVALNKFVNVNITESSNFGSIISKQYKEDSVIWKRHGSEMVLDTRDNTFNYIISAIKLTEEYAQSLNRSMKIYHLEINSELDSPKGKKYGLGSSAAVTVATIKGLCKFYDLPLDKDKLFKLAAIAHLDIQGNGSLGDIAASVYGGFISYCTFDHEWLKTARVELSLIELINQNWPKLQINQLPIPDDLKLTIGWTGSPASTSHLVDKVEVKKNKEQLNYQEFLSKSDQCINSMITGFKSNNVSLIQQEILNNRKILSQLSNFTEVPIETPLLTKLCDIAIHFGAAAKTSGAGGGDCGIVISNKNNDIHKMIDQWKENDIIELPLNIHHVTDF
ncbi:phosphomevalonate kinase [Lentilactobacillus laojiaonis]|uniref:phosphomevalonate kinase n=1 Tax=Lentilactobacillus laojiaonis TaxID=2883998 RepID=UPI001D0A58B3|nr:phosphomevalonate kinase [Lentilactobacillus laojiaonis]UDM32734.1 phosphomevalonate kinase [Lentilactobacillus laojiaonis]